MGYPAYQCFKTVDRDVYCSSTKVKNHASGASWVAQALAHFHIQASNIGKPYTSASIPSRATTYP